jgi:hypothetical protein
MWFEGEDYKIPDYLHSDELSLQLREAIFSRSNFKPLRVPPRRCAARRNDREASQMRMLMPCYKIPRL